MIDNPTPDGCRHCGIAERVHYTQAASGANGGLHKWIPPTDAQRLERMHARRASNTCDNKIDMSKVVDRYIAGITAELERLGAKIEQLPAATPTFDQVISVIDEIDRTRPVLVCRPEDEQRLTDAATQAGLNIRVVTDANAPAGQAYVQIPVPWKRS